MQRRGARLLQRNEDCPHFREPQARLGVRASPTRYIHQPTHAEQREARPIRRREPPSCMPAGSANTSPLLGDVRSGSPMMMPMSASPVMRPAANNMPLRLRFSASSSDRPLPKRARHEVVEQAAEEDRHHGLERQIDADRRGQHRHAERRLLRLQDLVEDDDGDADDRADRRSCSRAGGRRTFPWPPTP